jgi:hypothetical protein
MFISFVDEFTVWHLKLLNLFTDPTEWVQHNASSARSPQKSIGSLEGLLLEVFPELKGKVDFYDQVWNDLNARGLVSTSGLRVMMSPQGVMSPRSTDMGKKFLIFVKNPIS